MGSGFAVLSAEEKRVEIAKDALALLDSNVMAGRRQYYVSLNHGLLNSTRLQAKPEEQVQDLVESKWLLEKGGCTACALGATLLATVRKADDLTVGKLFGNQDHVGRDPLVRYLGRFFTLAQLDLMELAFEGLNGCPAGVRDRVPWDSRVAAAQFFLRHESDNERLKAIFRNIVVNNGTFVP
jgi:hypothetical protein